MSNRFELAISLINSAFDDDANAEVARILREAADQVEHGLWDTRSCIDANGNIVGQWEF